MRTITRYIVLIVLSLSVQFINAQNIKNSERIRVLEEERELIVTQEREFLKDEVEYINKQLEDGKITQEESVQLKKEAAERRALNIENRTAIIDNKIELLKRNEEGYIDNDGDTSVTGISISDRGSIIGIKVKGKNKPRKYDRRTSSDLVLAVGFNNAIVDGEKLDDSPYKFGGSRFLELGIAWKTRVFKESNFLRFKYGFSFQMNGLKPTNNQYFVMNGNETSLEEFPSELTKSKLLVTNLVFPMHFEFGPSKKIEHDKYFRYTTHNQFKIGIGGYAGFNIGTRQKLKYSINGDKVKDRIKRDYNTSNLVYGLSGYIAFDDVAVYAKYDLSPLFKDQVIDQNNISIGVRFDMD
ncbi:hypothetical protein [Urechidicola croceus]|uniref:Outer membrane protein beta-barrel domain-containing protein n=1 Tax=Urechidicola croceus TaxID=1850246 RepID=A0A1D8PA61_9FLAO|nr:hypothetical protein [Urechidicola croceus]AOW21406.1 hypothetical protein LPB138_12270 [Urechidicola croceus]